MKTSVQAATTSVIGLVAFILMVFVPAGTFDYWRGWAFIAVFAAATLIPSVYLAVHESGRPCADACKRALAPRPGPCRRSSSACAFVSVVAMIVVSALDFRFGWSAVPAAVSVMGLVLVAVGLSIAMLVTIQNGYAAANITVEAGQQLSSTGWYGFVRHPMYFGNVVLMIGVPLALGSYWGLLIVARRPCRCSRSDQRRGEALLKQELAGYDEYIDGCTTAWCPTCGELAYARHTNRNTATTAKRSTVFAMIVAFGPITPM